MAFSTREARSDDWEDIRRISGISGYFDYIGRMGPSYLDWGTVIVAISDGNILGFLKIEEMQDRSAWLSGLRVDPSRRREGIGKFLTDAAVNQAGKTGLERARMLIHSGNAPSLKLAETCGFHEIKEYDFYSGSVDMTGYVKSNEPVSEAVFVVWKVMIPNGTVNPPAELLSLNGNRIVVSSTDQNRFYHILSGDKFTVTAGDGIVLAEKGTMKIEGLKKLEDFDTGLVFEKETL